MEFHTSVSCGWGFVFMECHTSVVVVYGMSHVCGCGLWNATRLYTVVGVRKGMLPVKYLTQKIVTAVVCFGRHLALVWVMVWK